jgi:hypothetical protein
MTSLLPWQSIIQALLHGLTGGTLYPEHESNMNHMIHLLRKASKAKDCRSRQDEHSRQNALTISHPMSRTIKIISDIINEVK